MKALTVTLIAAIGLVAYSAIAKKHEVPQPQYFVWIAIVWSILGLVSDLGAPQIATVFSFGLVFAMAYSYLTVNGKAVGRADKNEGDL